MQQQILSTDGYRSPIGVSLTLRERIVDAVRDSIIKGDLKPGSRVSEPELARRFGISRTPVREALRQLDSEGFLSILPRRGARVSQFDRRDYMEYYQLKALLEGYAARLATPTITERQLVRLEQLNEQMERFYASGELRKIPRLHIAYHTAITEASENTQLMMLLKMLTNKFQRFTIQIALSGNNEVAFSQHREIVGAMRARNVEEAERLVRANALLGVELMTRELGATE